MRLSEITKDEFKDILSDPFVSAFMSDINSFKDAMLKHLESFDMFYQKFRSFEPVLGKYTISIICDSRKFDPSELDTIFNEHMSSQTYDVTVDFAPNPAVNLYAVRYEIYRRQA